MSNLSVSLSDLGPDKIRKIRALIDRFQGAHVQAVLWVNAHIDDYPHFAFGRIFRNERAADRWVARWMSKAGRG